MAGSEAQSAPVPREHESSDPALAAELVTAVQDAVGVAVDAALEERRAAAVSAERSRAAQVAAADVDRDEFTRKLKRIKAWSAGGVAFATAVAGGVAWVYARGQQAQAAASHEVQQDARIGNTKAALDTHVGKAAAATPSSLPRSATWARYRLSTATISAGSCSRAPPKACVTSSPKSPRSSALRRPAYCATERGSLCPMQADGPLTGAPLNFPKEAALKSQIGVGGMAFTGNLNGVVTDNPGAGSFVHVGNGQSLHPLWVLDPSLLFDLVLQPPASPNETQFQRLRYIGKTQVCAAIQCSLSVQEPAVGAVGYAAKLQLNGVDIPNSEQDAQTGGLITSADSLSVAGGTVLVENDEIGILVANLSTAADLVVSSGHIQVIALP